MNPAPLNALRSDADSPPPPPLPEAAPAKPLKVFLQLSGPLGFSYTAEMHGTSCAIGSSHASQIAIPHLGLAGRHVIVTNVSGTLTVTACPSADVSVNGKDVRGTVRLKDGDNIGLGPKLSATIRISHGTAESPGESAGTRPLWLRLRGQVCDYAARLGERRLVLPVLAALLCGMLLAVLWSRLSGQSPGDKTPVAHTSGVPQPRAEGSPDNTLPATNAAAVYEKKVKVAVKNVMRRIATGDATPYVDDAVVSDVLSQIDAYKDNAEVQEVLRGAPGQLRAAALLAQKEDVEPSLLVLTALLKMAESRGQTRADLATTAHSLLPRLKNMSIIFNSKDADSCLIVVAALHEVENGVREANLLKSLRSNVRDSRRERNFKFLYDSGGISRGAYEHVIKFLALGALALEPQTLGVEGGPLSF